MEKYDGIRILWNGEEFISRKGNIVEAPNWFKQLFPPIQFDGELWFVFIFNTHSFNQEREATYTYFPS